jgi:hypothetical protein
MLRNKISKDELLDLLYSKGYKIDIIRESESHDYYIAKFREPFSTDTYNAGRYSLDTLLDIRRDCALKLLQWSGMKVVYDLE